MDYWQPPAFGQQQLGGPWAPGYPGSGGPNQYPPPYAPNYQPPAVTDAGATAAAGPGSRQLEQGQQQRYDELAQALAQLNMRGDAAHMADRQEAMGAALRDTPMSRGYSHGGVFVASPGEALTEGLIRAAGVKKMRSAQDDRDWNYLLGQQNARTVAQEMAPYMYNQPYGAGY